MIYPIWISFVSALEFFEKYIYKNVIDDSPLTIFVMNHDFQFVISFCTKHFFLPTENDVLF